MERAEGLESEVIRRTSLLNLIAWTSVLMFFVLTGLLALSNFRQLPHMLVCDVKLWFLRT